MDSPLAVLIVEDSESDAQMIIRLLKKAGYKVIYTQVETAEQMRSALDERTWDVVLSDYNLPKFDGHAALELLKEKQQDIPFIVISGAIGEESAVALMKAGASDYLMKGNLTRLIPVLERELEQSLDRRERKQAEQALKESEEKYRLLVNNSPDHIVRLDLTGRILLANHPVLLGLEQKLNLGEEEFIGKTYRELGFPEELCSYWEQCLQIVFATNKPFAADYKYETPNGTRYFDWQLIPEMDREGRIVTVLAQSRDVTERKQAEKELQKNQANLTALIENTEDRIWAVDTEYRLIICNTLFTDGIVDDLKNKIFLGRSMLLDNIPQKVQDEWRGYYDRALRGESFSIELPTQFSKKPGYREYRFHPIHSADEKISGVVVSGRDITERKQAEETLRESESFAQALLKNSPIGISVRSRTGQLLSANEAWKKIWAISESDLEKDITRDRSLLSFNERDDYLNSHKEDVRRIYEVGGNLYIPELRSSHPRPGAAEWISQHFYAIQDAQGQVARVVILTEDITGRKLAHEIIRESEERLAAVMEGSQLGYSDWNIQTGEILRNERWAGMLGYTLKEIGTSYHQWEDLIHPDDRAAALQALQDHLNGKIPTHRSEYRLRAKDGSYRWILDQGKIVEHDPQGRPMRMTATHTDITERRQTEEQLQNLARAVEQSSASILITDKDGEIEYINPKFTSLNGYILDDVRGKTPRILKSGKMLPEIYVDLWQTILSGKEWRGELLNRKKNGQLYWEYASISAITDLHGNITHLVAVNEDITDRKEAEEKIRLLTIELERQTLTDYLTNLYNRRYFVQRSAEEFKRANRTNQPLALLMLDIDDFKKVNDSYGHEAGDFALKQVAVTLKSSLRETDVLGRMGGEEFAVILPNTPLDEAATLAERVRQAIESTSFKTSGEALTITITICIGVAAFTDKMADIDDMFRNADAALYHAKQNGRNRVIKYQKSVDEDPSSSFGANNE